MTNTSNRSAGGARRQSWLWHPIVRGPAMFIAHALLGGAFFAAAAGIVVLAWAALLP